MKDTLTDLAPAEMEALALLAAHGFENDLTNEEIGILAVGWMAHKRWREVGGDTAKAFPAANAGRESAEAPHA